MAIDRQLDRLAPASMIVLLCVRLVLGAATDAVDAEERGPTHHRIPDTVRWFMERESIDAPARIAKNRADDPQFAPGFALLYYGRINIYSQHPRLWLIGYQLGTWSGSAQNPDVHAAVVSQEDNEPLFRFADLPGDDGLGFEISPGRFALAWSYFRGTRPEYRGLIRLFALREPTKEILVYQCPDHPWWYSTLYFLDSDGDHTTDILVDRTVRDFDKKVKWQEYRIYRFDEKQYRYVEAERIARARFDELLTKAGGAAAVPHLHQSGPPFEISLDAALKVIDEPLQELAVPPVEHQDGKTR